MKNFFGVLFFTLFLTEEGLLAVGMLFFAAIIGPAWYAQNKEWTQTEQRDRIAFEKTFGMPSSLPENRYDDTGREVIVLRHNRILLKLEEKAQVIIQLEAQLTQARKELGSEPFDNRLASIKKLKSNLLKKATEFGYLNRIVYRFDYTPLDDDLDYQINTFGPDQGWGNILHDLKNDTYTY